MRLWVLDKIMRKYKNKGLPRGIQIHRGYVWIRFFPNGQEYLECVGNLNDPHIVNTAILLLNKYREEVRLGKFNLEKASNRVLTPKAVDLFLTKHAPTTRSYLVFKYKLKQFSEFFSNKYLDSITKEDIQQFRLSRQVMPSTFNRQRACIVSMFNKLREWKEQKIPPVKDWVLPKDNPASQVKKGLEIPRRRVLSPEEFCKFLEVASPNLKDIFLMATHSTLRLGDLKKLTRDSVNWSTECLEGVQSKTLKPFSIPMNSVIKEIISRCSTYELLNFVNFRKLFNTARKMSGLQNVQFRDLRRTGARLMLKNGQDIDTVSKFLGHSSIAMTQRYVPSDKEDLKKASGVLENVLSKALSASTSKGTGSKEEPCTQTVVNTVVSNNESSTLTAQNSI